MKKILGVLLASALLWSCGSQFSRSKYDRYMWNRSGGKTDKTTHVVTEEESKTHSGNFTETKKSELKMMDQEKTHPVVYKKTAANSEKLNNENTNSAEKEIVVSNTDNREPVKNTETKKSKSTAVKKTKNNPMQDADVDAMWVVTLILCFIIPPLGVYLKDGSITGLFWLVLICCILGGGILFGLAGYFGGLYGVGIILALLRFFDII